MQVDASIRTEDSDEDLVAYYVEWTDEAITELDGLINQMASAPTIELQTKVYEICHNIKGMGTSFGYPLMTEAGTSICCYLRRLDGDLADVHLLEAHLKSFKLILAKRMAGDGGQIGSELISRLNQLVEHMLGS